MRRLAAAAILGLALCACASPTHEVELELVADACTPVQLGEVTVISVEVLGINEQGRPCALAKRCLFDVGTLTSVDDVARILRETPQPLVDVEDEDAHTVAVIGHGSSCWDTEDHALCGYGDLASVEDGKLAIELACGTCAMDEILFCP